LLVLLQEIIKQTKQKLIADWTTLISDVVEMGSKVLASTNQLKEQLLEAVEKLHSFCKESCSQESCSKASMIK